MALSVRRLARIRLNARAPQALAGFFVRALGFTGQAPLGDVEVLALGPERVEIAPASGVPYPSDVPGWSPLFQHFAISTSDMATALARLQAAPGWTPISVGGPQRLPASSGGVAAFKFRDPEGHPLELIAFPGERADTPPRIDHSAISVADTARSVAFYQALGLTPGDRSLNRGPEQDRLDGLSSARVEVTALDLPEGGAHVELLCYQGDYPRDVPSARIGDVAATVLVMRGAGVLAQLRDPDGHLLQIEAAS